MADRITLVFILLLAAVYFYATEQIYSYEFGDPLGPKAFPRLLGVGLLITAALLSVEMWRETPMQDTKGQPAGDKRHLLVVAAVVIWTAIYFRVFVPVGYVISTAIYLLALTAYFNRGKWTANILTSVLFCVTSYLLFTKALGVTLPRGVLPF
jgi:putative tricarboxylic transport membrane protein